MGTQGKPGFLALFISGLLLTFPLVAIFYLSYRLAALPFPPFNLFDWQARILPGWILAMGIDTMVRVIGWFHVSNTSGVAKLAEQSMAVSEFIFAGMLLSALFFTFLRSGNRKASLLAGRILGVALGIATAWTSNHTEVSSNISPAAWAIWIVALFLFWGAALGWVYHRMIRDEGAAPETGSAAAPSAAERADRRRFLAGFAGVASVVAVVAAAIGKVGGQHEAVAPAAGEPWSASHPLPNAGAAVQPAPGTRSELTRVSQHYRIDINTSSPSISEAA
jgi:hypothetical protein